MFKRINYYWRVVATGMSFALFGVGGLLLSVFVFPVQRLVIKDEEAQKRVARKTVHYTFKFFITFMDFVGMYKFDFTQAKQLKSLNGHLIMANHPSLIDVVMLISMIPNADCVVKTHLFKNVFLKGVVNNTGYISNADPAGLLEDCEASLKAGNNLIIFPQGTRSKPDESLKFQRGAANIAIRCQAKITTVMLKVVPLTLTKNTPWYKIPPTKAHFSAMVVDHSPTLPENNVLQTSKNVRQYNRDLEIFFTEELSKHG
ncbi:MAG: lysophospholipid acyltransferase family protein [Cognaticolwellia sp.]